MEWWKKLTSGNAAQSARLSVHARESDHGAELFVQRTSVERLYAQSRITTLHFVGFKAISFSQQASRRDVKNDIGPRYFVTCRAADSRGVSALGAMMARSA